jgi:hypothetical protein|tara:strand:- start:127 stop:681 length:555 start_codon:yes stop_codon:yes gene_type:complete
MDVGIFLQFFGFFGGDIGNLLFNLERLGFFDFILPFLIIFAIVYGILSKVHIFGTNKSIDAIIALSVGLMALQFGVVSVFFAELFPRFGIGLSIILVIMILLGLFKGENDDAKWFNYVMLAVGAIIVIVILIQSAEGFGFYSGYWWSENWPSLLAIVAVGAGIIAVVAGTGSSKKPEITIPYVR